jgi:hypothetical protein
MCWNLGLKCFQIKILNKLRNLNIYVYLGKSCTLPHIMNFTLVISHSQQTYLNAMNWDAKHTFQN